MSNSATINHALNNAVQLFEKLGAAKFVVIFGFILLIVLSLNRLVDGFAPKIAAVLTTQADRASKDDRILQLKRAETFLSVALAAFKALTVLAAIFIAYKVTIPANQPVAVIGVSAFFFILLSATIGPLLRDISTGVIMIFEDWYNVGDHIAVEPFVGVSGVVERITLRSTKLRSVTGEIIWIHNQYINGIKRTPGGVRTIAVDVFVSDLEQGKRIVEQVIGTLPKGATMVARKLAIVETEQLSDELWRIKATGQTAPGREWLIEDFAVAAIVKNDTDSTYGPVITHGPIVHYADAMAERRFKRAIRSKN